MIFLPFFFFHFVSGAVRRARGGAVIRTQSFAVPKDGDDLVVKGGDGNGGLLASYLRALDNKPIITKVGTGHT